MLSLEQDPPINPGVGPSPDRVASAVLDSPTARQTLRWDLTGYEEVPSVPWIRAWRRPRRPRRSPALLAERLVGQYAPTLREALVLVLVLAGLLGVVAWAFGPVGVLVGLGLCGLTRLFPGRGRTVRSEDTEWSATGCD
jgi:hypothetical protein